MNYFAFEKENLALFAFFLLNCYLSIAVPPAKESKKVSKEHEKFAKLLEPTITQLSDSFKQNRKENFDEDIKKVAAIIKRGEISRLPIEKLFPKLKNYVMLEVKKVAVYFGYKSLKAMPSRQPSECNILDASAHILFLAAQVREDEVVDEINKILPCYMFVFAEQSCDQGCRRVVTQGLTSKQIDTIQAIFDNRLKPIHSTRSNNLVAGTVKSVARHKRHLLEKIDYKIVLGVVGAVVVVVILTVTFSCCKKQRDVESSYPHGRIYGSFPFDIPSMHRSADPEDPAEGNAAATSLPSHQAQSQDRGKGKLPTESDDDV